MPIGSRLRNPDLVPKPVVCFLKKIIIIMKTEFITQVNISIVNYSKVLVKTV